MPAPSIDIRSLLISDGISTPIFIGEEPDSPDDVLTIYDTGGQAPNPKWLLDNPTFQIRSRSTDYELAYNNCLSVRDKLLGRPITDVGTYKYTGIYAETDILALQRDEKRRMIFVCNFRAIRWPASGDNRDPL